MVQKARKKPVEIEFMLFKTNNEVGSPNMDSIINWCNKGKNNLIDKDYKPCWHNGTDIYIETLEGTMTATVGDYIIKGVQGEFYPCKPDIFLKTYDILWNNFQQQARVYKWAR